MLKRWESSVESSRASNPLMNGLSIAQLARVSSWLVKSSEQDDNTSHQNDGSSKEEEEDESDDEDNDTPGDPMTKLSRLLRVTGHHVDMSVDDMKDTWKSILKKYTTPSGNFISIDEEDDDVIDGDSSSLVRK